MAAGNKNLNSTKTARKDEFYTQLTDIEKEMRYYRKHFKDKTVSHGDGSIDSLGVMGTFHSDSLCAVRMFKMSQNEPSPATL